MGSSALLQRESAIYDGLEAAGGHQLEDRGEFGFGAHVGAENGELAAEKKAQIDFGVEAGGGSAGDQAAAARKAGEAVVPGGHADVFKDHVHTTFRGEAADFVLNFLRFVIDGFVGAKLFSFGEFSFVASGGNDPASEKFGDLNRRRAYTASCSKDEDIFAGLQLRAGEQHVPGSLKNQRDGRRLFKRKIFRMRKAVHVRAAYEFRATAVNQVAEIGKLRAIVVKSGEALCAFAAGDARSQQNFLASSDSGDARAGFFDDTSDVAPGNVREWNRESGDALANPEVEMVEGASVHANEDFAETRFGFGRVFVLQDIRLTVFFKNHRFHGRLPRKVYGICRGADCPFPTGQFPADCFTHGALTGWLADLTLNS